MISKPKSIRPAKRRGNTRFQIIASSVILVVTIGLFVLLLAQRKSPDQKKDDRKSPLVEVVKLRKYDKSLKISLTGFAVPHREIQVTAQVMGTITKKTDKCKAGRYVVPTDHLISIDSEKYKLVKDRLLEEKKEIEEKQKQLKRQLPLEQQTLQFLADDRQNKESETAKKEELYKQEALSETEINAARSSLTSARNLAIQQQTKVDMLETDIKIQANLLEKKIIQIREATIDLDNAVVNAPAHGVVISENVQEDGFVQIGAPLFVFEDTSAIEIRCDLRADQLEQVLRNAAPGFNKEDRYRLPPTTAKIYYKGIDQTYEWTGTLDRYDGLGLNEKTRTAPCRILVNNLLSKTGGRTLVRGMFLRIELILENQQSGLISIPSSAVRAGDIVWINNDSKLRKEKIEIVNRYQDSKGKEHSLVRVKPSVLESGMEVIVSPIPLAVDKMELRVFSKDQQDSGDDNSESDPDPNTVQNDESKEDSKNSTNSQVGSIDDATGNSIRFPNVLKLPSETVEASS